MSDCFGRLSAYRLHNANRQIIDLSGLPPHLLLLNRIVFARAYCVAPDIQHPARHLIGKAGHFLKRRETTSNAPTVEFLLKIFNVGGSHAGIGLLRLRMNDQRVYLAHNVG